MNYDLFFFLVFLSISSFALAFIVYIAILKIFGDKRWIEMLLVPLAVVAFDFFVMVVEEEYKYFVGAIPMAIVAGLIGYAYFFKNIPLGGEDNAVQPVGRDEKKYSAKSARIHAARAKRGKD